MDRCTVRHTYMQKDKEQVKQYQSITLCFILAIIPACEQTHMIAKITKNIASLHIRTQSIPFGQVDNCVDSRVFTWGSLKIHNVTYTMYVRTRYTDCRTKSILRSTLVHIKHHRGDKKHKSIISTVSCKTCKYANIKETLSYS